MFICILMVPRLDFKQDRECAKCYPIQFCKVVHVDMVFAFTYSLQQSCIATSRSECDGARPFTALCSVGRLVHVPKRSCSRGIRGSAISNPRSMAQALSSDNQNAKRCQSHMGHRVFLHCGISSVSAAHYLQLALGVCSA